MKIKRTAATVALACMLVLLLAGCVHMNVNLKINADGSADYGMDMLMDKGLISQAEATGQDVWAQARTQLEDEGFTVTDAQQDNYTGISAMKHYDDVSKISEDNAMNSAVGIFGSADTDSSFSVKADKGFFGTTYTVKSAMDVSKTMAASLNGLDQATLNLLNDVKVNMVVTLPVKASSNDATSVSADGLTYTWELKLDKPNAINLAATVPNVLNIALAGGGALLVIVVVVVIVILAGSAKKRRARVTSRLSGR